MQMSGCEVLVWFLLGVGLIVVLTRAPTVVQRVFVVLLIAWILIWAIINGLDGGAVCYALLCSSVIFAPVIISAIRR